MNKVFYTNFSEVSGERLDSLYYANLGLYKGLCKLKAVAKVKGGKRIPKGKGFSAEVTEYKYLRVEDIDSFGYVRVSNLKNIHQDIFDELRRYKLNKEEIIISNAGTIGKISMFENLDTNIILTENCVKLIPLNEKVIPQFLLILLQSNFIQLQFQNNYIKTTIPKLSVERISNTFIPNIPSFDIQNIVIDKMKKANCDKKEKEKKAKALLESIDDYLLDALGIELPSNQEDTLEDRVFFRKFSGLSGDRIDSTALHYTRTMSIENLKQTKYHIVKLKNLTSFSKEIVTKNNDNLPYLGLENIESNIGIYKEGRDKESFSSAIRFKKGQILFPKLRPYLNKVYYAEFDGLCSTEFHILDSDKIDNNYLSIFLRSQIVVSQTKCLMSGNTLPRLQTEDIKELLIVLPPLEIQKKIAKENQRVLDASKALQEEATATYNNAKLEVEKMILEEDIPPK